MELNKKREKVIFLISRITIEKALFNIALLKASLNAL